MNLNPYSPPTLEADEVTIDKTQHTANTRIDQLLLVVVALVGLVGGPLALWEIETIIGSGIAIVVTSLLLLIRERICYWKSSRALSYINLLIALLVFAFSLGVTALIWGNGWSPTEATKHHIGELVVGFGILILLLSIMSMARLPRTTRTMKLIDA